MNIKPVPAQMIIQMEYEEGFHDGYRQAMREMPEIVRCKDCKHQYQYRTGSCPYYTTYGSVAPNDWFCAEGVKCDDVLL